MTDEAEPRGSAPAEPVPPTAGPPVMPYPASVRYPSPQPFPTAGPVSRSAKPAGDGVPPGYSQYIRTPMIKQSPSGSPVLAIIAAVLATATAAVLIVGLYVHNRSDKVRTFVAPAAFGTYTRVTESGAAILDATLQSFLRTANAGKLVSFYDKGSLAVYAAAGSTKPRLGMIYYATEDLGSLGNGNRQHYADDLVSIRTVPDGASFDAGPLSGRVRCGNVIQGGTMQTVCSWSGPVTSGVAISISPKDKAKTLAAVVSEFRMALEKSSA